MVKKVLFIFLLLIFLSSVAFTQSSGFGVGVMLGEPTGISLKSWLSNTNAWDAGLAWGLGKYDAFYLHADYLWHNYNAIKLRKGRLPVYYGLGGRLVSAGETHIGVRGVLGLDYQFSRLPLDIFFELAPVFDVVPASEINFNGAIGIRYFLK